MINGVEVSINDAHLCPPLQKYVNRSYLGEFEAEFNKALARE
jgi:hypothetical protein